jgi:hypothetical protein
MFQKGIVISLWLVFSSYSYGSVREIEDRLNDISLTSSMHTTSNASLLTIEELEQTTMHPLEGNHEVQ